MTDQDEWWCALCPTSHPSEEVLIAHTAADHPLPTGSTSAQLLRMQTAYAASQADLTKALAERDVALALGRRLADNLSDTQQERDDLRHELAHVRFARDMAATRLTHWHGRALKAEAELASAQQELARLRPSLHTGESPMSDRWRRSSYCGTNACVEVARAADGSVRLRDSKQPERTPLSFSAEEWEAFRLGVVAGEFGGGVA